MVGVDKVLSARSEVATSPTSSPWVMSTHTPFIFITREHGPITTKVAAHLSNSPAAAGIIVQGMHWRQQKLR